MQFSGDLPSAAESWGYVLVRWATFTSLVQLVGASVFLWVVQPTLARTGSADLAERVRVRVRAVGVVVAAVAMVLAIARLVLQRQVLTDTLGDGTPVALADVLSGAWGVGVGLQTLAGAAGVGAHSGRSAGRVRRVLMVLALLAAVLSPSLSGHAVGESLVGWPMVADVVHVLAAGAWVGVLLLLAVVVLPAAHSSRAGDASVEISMVLRAFSPIALGSAALLAVSGTYAGAVHIGSLAGLTSTRYGTALLWKVALVGAMAGIGALNWKRMGPGAQSVDGVPRLWRTVMLEAMVALAVIFVTAILVARGTPVDLLD